MNQNVDVIRHHAPRQKFIRLFMFKQESRFRHRRNSQIAQMTLANPTIEIFLQFFAFLAVIFYLEQVFPFTATGDGHGIGEAKRDELDETRKVAMRQVATLVPAQKAKRLFFIGKRAFPTILVRNQITKVFAFGLRLHFRNADLQIGSLVLFLIWSLPN